MRTGGIIRIIVGLVAAVLLTAFLVLMLNGVNLFRRIGVGYGQWDRWRGEHAWEAGDSNAIVASSGEPVSVPTGGIREIKIDWLAGSVVVFAGEDDEITFFETSSSALNESTRMRYSIANGKLHIEYWNEIRKVWNWLDFDAARSPTKHLTLTVPASLIGSLPELDIGTVSANIELDGICGAETSLGSVSGDISCKDLACDELELSTTSGRIQALNCAARDLEIGSVSGNMSVEGTFVKADSQTVSGGVKLRLLRAPERLECDSVSGDLTIQLPEDSGFTLRLDTVSGQITCELPGTMGDKRIVCGDGSGDYRTNSVSGNVRIQKLS